MPSQNKLDQYYMSLALRVAELSHGVRARVGSCLVTENDVSILSCNGLPEALGNDLEYEAFGSVNIDSIDLSVTGGYYLPQHNQVVIPVPEKGLISKPTVIHAELNAVLKCAKEGVSVKGATIYTTLSCCAQCASMLASCGISRVVYLEEYRDTSGIDILKTCGIVVDKLNSEF